MPRQTINQTRGEESEEQKSRVLLKDDSFINERLIPKKANDDRRHSARNFRSKRKLDYQIESGSFAFARWKVLVFMELEKCPSTDKTVVFDGLFIFSFIRCCAIFLL